MRILLLVIASLPVVFAARPLPPHVTLVRPLRKAPPRTLVAAIPPAAQPPACGHIRTVPADANIDPGILHRVPAGTNSRMPVLTAVPPCVSLPGQ